jgi:protein arginine kinase
VALRERDDISRIAASKNLPAYLKTPGWVSAVADSPDADVVLSSRARLARNLADFSFPGRASESDLRRTAQEIRRAALADTERLADLTPVSIPALSSRDSAELLDARRISPELAEGGQHRYALLDDSGLLSVFINEEDHIRIQALAPGNAVLAALRAAEDADTRLAKRLMYAQSPEWGYLTTALSNMGTGLRLSALAHLPALAFLGRLPETLKSFYDLDISVRGAHGEYSQAAGDLYQVSNAVTFGVQTVHLAGRVRPVVDYLVKSEREAREEVATSHRERVLALAQEAWGKVERADRLDAVTALDLLSLLRLSASVGLTPAPDAVVFATLVMTLHTGRGLTPQPSSTSQPGALRDAIQRPAKIRTALRHFFL